MKGDWAESKSSAKSSATVAVAVRPPCPHISHQEDVTGKMMMNISLEQKKNWLLEGLGNPQNFCSSMFRQRSLFPLLAGNVCV